MDNMAPPDGSRRRDLAMPTGSLSALRGLGAQNAGVASMLTRTPTPPHRRAGAGPATAPTNDGRGARHGGRAMKRGTALWAAEGTQRSLREARQDKGRDHAGTGRLFSRGDAGPAPGFRACADGGTAVMAFYVRSDAGAGLVNAPWSG